jgi:hypothetical protein
MFRDDRIVCGLTDDRSFGCADMSMRERDPDFVASDRPFHSKIIGIASTLMNPLYGN